MFLRKFQIVKITELSVKYDMNILGSVKKFKL